MDQATRLAMRDKRRRHKQSSTLTSAARGMRGAIASAAKRRQERIRKEEGNEA